MRPFWSLLAAPFLLSCALAQPPSDEQILKVEYDGFTLWLDCAEHGALQFRYQTRRDSGNLPRPTRFRRDPGVPAECQPGKTSSFRTNKPEPAYDRGHLVPANHFDDSQNALEQTFLMTNILPQTAVLNRGAWLASEEIIECYRDQEDLLVIGGAIWGDETSNDYFQTSHNIRTPDAFWKIVVRSDGKTIAWLMPNDINAYRERLDEFLITPARIQKAIGYKVPDVPRRQLKRKPTRSWPLPPDCDLK